MFTISARVYDGNGYHVKTFGIFSSFEKANEAIEILVHRYIEEQDEDFDEEELTWMIKDYREHFEIVSLLGVDDMEIFKTGDIPYF